MVFVTTCEDYDEDLQLALALSRSHADDDGNNNASKLTQKGKRYRTLLPMPKIKPTSGMLLHNVYAKDPEIRINMNALIDEMFNTLSIISNGPDATNRNEIPIDKLACALSKIGFTIDTKDLDSHVNPYRTSPFNDEYSLKITHEFNGRNVTYNWGLGHTTISKRYMTRDEFHRIFLDAKLRTTPDGQLY